MYCTIALDDIFSHVHLRSGQNTESKMGDCSLSLAKRVVTARINAEDNRQFKQRLNQYQLPAGLLPVPCMQSYVSPTEESLAPLLLLLMPLLLLLTMMRLLSNLLFCKLHIHLVGGC